MKFNVTPLNFKIVKLDTFGPNQKGPHRGQEKFLGVMVIGDEFIPVTIQELWSPGIEVELVTDEGWIEDVKLLVEKYINEDYFKSIFEE